MKYLCLANYKPSDMAAMSAADRQALVSQCPAKDAELKASGHLLLSASLGEHLARMEPRGGKAQVTDGPFAESKEIVGGFFIIEAADRDEAVRIASLHPAATLGEQAGWCIDVHAIGFFQQYDTRGVAPEAKA